MVAVQNIRLDSDIRDWVLLPLLFIILFVGFLRHYVTVLLNSKPSGKQDVSNARNQAVATYCRQLVSMGQFLNHNSLRTRAAKYMDGPLKQEIKADPMAAMTDPSMMTNMMKQNVTTMVPNMVMMAIAQNFFGGFVVARFPFALSAKFKGMLQQGVAIDNLDCAYATSLSLFFLAMYALNGVLKLLLGAEADASNASAMAMANPMMAAATQAQPGVDLGKVYKQLTEDLQYTLDHHRDVVEHSALWLSQGR